MSAAPEPLHSIRVPGRRRTFFTELMRDLKINRYIYLMVLPAVIYYAVFHYFPMYGVQIAFKDYFPARGMLNSPWVGFKHFQDFFNSFYFWRLVRNTLLLSFYDLIFAFTAPIVLALLLNELRTIWFKRVVQTVTYLPYFISIVVVAGMMVDFLARDGLINNVLVMFGFEKLAYLVEPGWFRTIFIGSGIWQNVGWGSIIYLATIANIDPSLYEAAKVDGANRWKQTVHITIPGMLPTIIILLILQIGNIMSVNTDKILLLYNTSTYETADVIGSYVYRKGLLQADFSYSTAIGLFNSVINFGLLIAANSFSKRLTDTKLW
ncbi:ABC transporter permease [Paenibacillus eucommiae]|uniref:Aldouronate transport system permease protein n=1 Tax=Paenibacillus eucommiae TaxID=1355755 RepID=A0ABS4IWK1_9BACL|nr:ABC transporter permease subunit [Paenibacillus eucommiae]MBP1991970.1 putative aldouronate transport system permease protein [Paenibacillus eucommiae]